MEPESSIPHSQAPSTCPCPEPDKPIQCLPSLFFKISFSIILSSDRRSLNHISLFHCWFHAKWSLQVWGLVKCFVRFLWQGVLSTSPNPRLADHPLLTVHICLINIFTAAIHIWRPFLHLQPEDTPCCDDRDPFIVGIFSVVNIFSQKLLLS
jgi:hypothetical protein